MPTPNYERLFELFAWAHRAERYRVRFRDGDEYWLTGVAATEDEGELPHASAAVHQTICRADGGTWPAGNAMSFYLPDVAEVADAATGEILYQAV